MTRAMINTRPKGIGAIIPNQRNNNILLSNTNPYILTKEVNGDLEGDGIVSAGKEMAQRLWKHRELIKKMGSKAAGFYTGETGTKLKNLIPSSDNTSRPAFVGENHAILKLSNGKNGYANYMGPGTNVLGRVKRGDMGRTPSDMVAKRHDIDYQLAAVVGNKKKQLDLVRKADNRMVNSLNKIQREGRGNSRNIMLGKRLIQAKMIGENIGALDRSRFAGDLETITPQQRNTLISARSDLQQKGYGISLAGRGLSPSGGMYQLPGKKLKMKILKNYKRGTMKGRGKKSSQIRHGKDYYDKKQLGKILGNGLSLPGRGTPSGRGINPSGGFFFMALAALGALIGEAVSAVTVASVGSAVVSGAVSTAAGIAVSKIAGKGMSGKGVKEVVKKVAQKVAQHKKEFIKHAENISVHIDEIPKTIKNELQKRLDKINKEGGDKKKILGIVKTLVPVIRKVYNSKLAKKVKGNLVGGKVKITNDKIFNMVRKNL